MRRCSNLRRCAVRGQLAWALVLLLSTTIFYVTSFVNDVWRIIGPITFNTEADMRQYDRFMQHRFVILTAALGLNVSETFDFSCTRGC